MVNLVYCIEFFRGQFMYKCLFARLQTVLNNPFFAMKVAILQVKPYARLHAYIKETRSMQGSRFDFYGPSTQTHTYTLADTILQGKYSIRRVYNKIIKIRFEFCIIWVQCQTHLFKYVPEEDSYYLMTNEKPDHPGHLPKYF